ncbi:MAG: hypothetical protein SA339_04735 [Methanomassiliicoccus sp.]|nr:hypothetical protein [Methanomassiliicoccus sp.]
MITWDHINQAGESMLALALGVSTLIGIILLIFVLIVLVVIIKALAVLIPGAAVALVVWLLTSSPLYTGLTFLVVTVLFIIYRH